MNATLMQLEGAESASGGGPASASGTSASPRATRDRVARVVAPAVTLALALASALCVFWATHWGAGLFGDGHAYVASARNVVAGHWVTFEDYTLAADPKPLEQFPVGFPLMLAAGHLLGIDAIPFARWLNMSAVAATVTLAGWLLWVRARSLLVLAVGLAVLALSPAVLRNHVRIMTEGAFVTCCALMLACLIGARRRMDNRPLRTVLLCIAALAAGWSCTLRYAGVFLIISGAAALLLWPAREPSGASEDDSACPRYTTRARGFAALLFLLVASLLPAAQAVFNLWVIGRPTSRALAWHPPSVEKFRDLFEVIGGWLLPSLPIPAGDPAAEAALKAGVSQIVGAAALAALLFVPPIVAVVRWRRGRGWPGTWPVTMWLFAGGYAPFIVAAHTLQDAGIPFNSRIFFPLWFSGWVFAAGTIGAWLVPPQATRRSFALVLAGALVAGVLASNLASLWTDLERGHSIGWAFEGPRWHKNRILETIRSDHASVKSKPLVGNGGDLVGLTTDRRMAHVPLWFSRPRNRPYTKMPARLRQFGRWAMANDGRIVYFNQLDNRYDYLSSEAMLAEHLHLKVLVEKPEGRIYRVDAIKGFEDEDYDADGRPDWENLDEPLRTEVRRARGRE